MVSSSLNDPLEASSSRVPALDEHTDPSSSTTTDFPTGSLIIPTDLGAIRVYLKDMVTKKKSNSITTLDVYSEDPWLLDHVHNDMFRRDEWYYFSKRSKRSSKTVNRTVSKGGKSEGGTWKSTSGKEPIMDKDKNVQGYKQNFVYNKLVNGEIKKTDWLMTEYCLYDETQDELVLCHIRGKIEKKVKDGFVKQVPQVKNSILSNQVQDEETGLTGGVNRIGMTMLQRDHGDATQQQQQQQEQDTPILVFPTHEGQNSGFETQNNNDNNFINQDFPGADNLMIDISDLINEEGDVPQPDFIQPIAEASFTQ